jgi:methionine salvage enolase-phosphatase E1
MVWYRVHGGGHLKSHQYHDVISKIKTDEPCLLCHKGKLIYSTRDC